MKRIVCFLLVLMFILPVFSMAAEMPVTSLATGDRDILFSNNYRGFCLDVNLHGTMAGDSFITAENTSAATNNNTNIDISQPLKILFTQCFETLFQEVYYADGSKGYQIKDTNTVQAVVWHFSDDQYVWSEMKDLANAVNSYSGPAIPDYGYTRTLSNGDSITFSFMVIQPNSSGIQDFFAYKIAVSQAPAHEHYFGEAWQFDDGQHWQECECGEKKDVGSHIETVINQTEPSEFQDGYTGDTVCEICGKLLNTGSTIPSTHEHFFAETWTFNDSQHWHECICGEKIDIVDHTVIVINQKEASEFEAGYSGDSFCEVCREVLNTGITIPATHVHSFRETWEFNAVEHWRECPCGEKKDIGSHTETVTNRRDPSEFNPGYTGDTICETCRNLLNNGTIIPATHVHIFGEAWEFNESQHWRECSCGDKNEVADHTETVINRREPSLFVPGYTGDTICETCRTLLSEGSTISATHVHAFSETWTYNDSQHWHECECGEKKDITSHTEIVVNRREPSEFEDGYTGDTICEECRKLLETGSLILATHEHSFPEIWLSNDDQHWRECPCGEKNETEEHIETVTNRRDPSAFESGYTGDTVCEVCQKLLENGTTIPATHEHAFSETWTYNDSQHWHECECGEKKDITSHTEIVINRREPSEFEGGYTGDTICEECRKPLGTGNTIPATHRHSFKKVWKFNDEKHWRECKCGEKDELEVHIKIVINRKEATEFKEGYTGDIVCEKCEKLLERGETIAATHQHVFTESWKYSRKEHWHECACGAEKDHASHTYVNGLCFVCGRKNPNHVSYIPDTSDHFIFTLFIAFSAAGLLSLCGLVYILHFGRKKHLRTKDDVHGTYEVYMEL